MYKYIASVNIGGQIVKTYLFADNTIHARLLVQYAYGMNSLVGTPQLVNESSTTPPNPQQQRIKSLQTQKDNVAKQLKAERDRQKLTKARQTIQTLSISK